MLALIFRISRARRMRRARVMIDLDVFTPGGRRAVQIVWSGRS